MNEFQQSTTSAKSIMPVHVSLLRVLICSIDTHNINMAEKKEVDPVPIFMGIGLAEPKAKETLNNKHLTATLLTLLEEVCFTRMTIVLNNDYL